MKNYDRAKILEYHECYVVNVKETSKHIYVVTCALSAHMS